MDEQYWNGRKVLVTGGAGFVGHRLVRELLNRGSIVTVIDNLSRGRSDRISRLIDVDLIVGDLRNEADTARAVHGQDLIFHLAAPVGGIYYSMEHHFSMFCEAMVTTCNLMEAATRSGVRRMALASSACAYSGSVMGPQEEGEAHMLDPEPGSEGYGWAKRMSEHLGEWAWAEKGLEVVTFRPANAIGPDDVDDETGHVIPQVLRRLLIDKQDPLEIYGHGNQLREFMHVSDYVGAAMAVAERGDHRSPQTYNIGSGEVVSIQELVARILDHLEDHYGMKRPRVFYNPNYPTGHPAKFHNLTRLREELGYVPQVKLGPALAEIIDDYVAQNVTTPVLSR